MFLKGKSEELIAGIVKMAPLDASAKWTTSSASYPSSPVAREVGLTDKSSASTAATPERERVATSFYRPAQKG